MKRHVSNSFYGLLDYAAYPIGMLVVAPIVLRNLGSASYGVWTIVMALANIGAIIASGFGDAIIQQVAAQRANGIADGLVRVVRSAIAIHLLLGVFVGATLYVAAPYLSARVAPIDFALRTMVLSSTRVAAILVLLRAIETVCISVQRGFERYGAAIKATVAARLVSLLAAAVLASLSYTITCIMIATTGITLLGVGTQLLFLRRVIGVSSLRPGLDRAATRELFDFGKFTWIMAITSVVFAQSDRLIGGAAVGASALVAYALCAQIAQPVYGLAAAGLHFVFPYLAFRRATSSPAGLRRMVLKVFVINTALVGTGVPVLLIFSPPLLRLLATDAVARSCAPLLPGVVASSAILALTAPGSYTMLALGHVRTLTMVNIAAGSAMFLVSLEFLSRQGINAIVGARLAFALIALSIYIPLSRTLEFIRVPPHPSPIETHLTGREGA